MFRYIISGVGVILSIWCIYLMNRSMHTAQRARILEDLVARLYEGEEVNVGVIKHDKEPHN